METEAEVFQRKKQPFVSPLPAAMLNLLPLFSSCSSEEIIHVRKQIAR